MPKSHHNIGNGKIYKLVIGEFFYYGSTLQSPCERLYNHKVYSLIKPKRKLYKHISDNGGWDALSITIEVVERPNCETKQDLRAKENEYILKERNNPFCLNDYLAAPLPPVEHRALRTEQNRRLRETRDDEWKEERRVRHNELQKIRRHAKGESINYAKPKEVK